jgi:hypothetical protein
MVVFVLPKWAKLNELTRHMKLYQDFQARTQLFTRLSLENPTQQKVVAQAPWPVQLWLVDADCTFYDQGPTTLLDQPTSIRVPHEDTEESIAALRKFSSTAIPLHTDLTKCDEYNPATVHCRKMYKYSLLIIIRTFPSEGRTTSVRCNCNISKGSDAYSTTNTSRCVQVRTVNLTSQMTRQARFPVQNEPRRDSPCKTSHVARPLTTVEEP